MPLALRTSAIFGPTPSILVKSSEATCGADSSTGATGAAVGAAATGSAPAAGAGALAPVSYTHLTLIEGIGPKIAELLNEAGIHSFSDLASSDAEKIKEILAAQGGLMATRNPTTWPQQGRMAADGQWDELKKWQDELDGGV